MSPDALAAQTLEAGDLDLQLPGTPDVVRVEERHVLTVHLGERPVAGCGRTAVRLRVEMHPRIRAEAGGQRLRRAVGRSVVDHHGVAARVGLREHALDRAHHPRDAVVRRDDHRDLTRTHRAPHLFSDRHVARPGQCRN
jgi:hypothetical protein